MYSNVILRILFLHRTSKMFCLSCIPISKGGNNSVRLLYGNHKVIRAKTVHLAQNYWNYVIMPDHNLSINYILKLAFFLFGIINTDSGCGIFTYLRKCESMNVSLSECGWMLL